MVKHRGRKYPLNPTIITYFTAGSILVIFSSTNFFQCPIYHVFGIYCPGCGATRALKALTEGNFMVAVHDNLLVLLMPILAGVGMAIKSHAKSSTFFKGYILVLAAAVILFTVARNQPGSFFIPTHL